MIKHGDEWISLVGGTIENDREVGPSHGHRQSKKTSFLAAANVNFAYVATTPWRSIGNTATFCSGPSFRY